MRRCVPWGALLFLMLLSIWIFSACSDDHDEAIVDGDAAESDGETPYDNSLFVDGCPEAGKAMAKRIDNPKLKMQGPDAIGTVDDYLLMNDKAAFIVEGPENRNAYYLYGGVVVDAVALSGCEQANPERLEEVGILWGNLKATDFAMSVLRAFKGETVELVNDGSDGQAAVVRVHGTDDYFWIVELELIRSAFHDGKEKRLSEPFQVETWVDYILEPGSSVLRIETNFKNKKTEKQSFLVGSAVLFGDSVPVRYYADAVFEVGGFSLLRGIPWLAASNGEGAYAFAFKDADMGSADIGGLSATVDINQAMSKPVALKPAGEDGDTAKTTWFLAVGGTDSNSAVKHMHALNPTPIPKKGYTTVPVSGLVTEEDGQTPIAGALVEFRMKNGGGSDMVLDSFTTDEQGRFSGEAADFGKDFVQSFVAKKDGRPDSTAVAFSTAHDGNYVLTMKNGGVLNHVVKDDDGKEIPAKILLFQSGQVVKTLYVMPEINTTELVPGEYSYMVTRGYEYTTYSGEFVIEAGKTTDLPVTLDHVVDTSGFLCMDGHVHAGPSPDNQISIPDRIRTVAAEGLEVVIGTDHEYISNWRWGIDEAGLGDWVANVIGEEVTATAPEHTNMYPVEPRFDLDARGGYVRWYGLSLGEIFAAEKERGAQIRSLNHPRGFFNDIQYDLLSGEPKLNDPTLMGLPASKPIWSWDFETLEMMNDPQVIFRTSADSTELDLFDVWQSFFNLGHPKTAVGCSDVHNWGMPGRPRNYFVSSTDDAKSFVEADLITAMKEGRSMISNGAFMRVMLNDTASFGATLTDSDGTVEVKVHIEAIPEIDVTYFKIYLNCDQVATVVTSAPDQVVKYDGTAQVAVDKDANLVVAAFGEKDMPKGLGAYNAAFIPRVISNPVFIDFDGNGNFDPPGGKTCTYDLLGPD